MNAIIEWLNAWGARWAGFALPMLVQSAVLIALLFALDLALRTRVRATIRYAVWMLALVKLALPPSLASPTGAAYWLPPERAGTYATPAPAADMAATEFNIHTAYKAAADVRGIAPLSAVSPGLAWQADCFVVWLAVTSGMGLWVIWRLRVVVGVLRESAEAPETLRALLESCRQQLALKHAMPVRCAAIGTPAICGVFRPMILIPPSLAEHLDASEMRSVLLHELAHYKRGDLWVNHAQILLQIVYWYNPLLWLANACIRRAREEAVDEMVLVEMGGEAPAYPATLLHVAKLGLGRPAAALGLMGILEPGRGLTQRILHIMNRPLPRSARIGARGFAAVLLLALVALPMACRSKMEPAPAPTTKTTQINQADAASSTDDATQTIEQRLRDARDRGDAAPRKLHTNGGDVVPEKIEIHSVDLPDAIEALGKQAGLEVQIDPALLHQKAADGTPLPPPRVTVKWTNVTALQAMQALLEDYGWQMTQIPGNPILRIGAKAPTGVIHKILIQRIGPAIVSDVLIRANIDSKEGELFSRAQVDKDVKSIYATGFFYSVRVSDTTTPNGVDLVFVINERPVVTDIQFVGNKKMTQDALRKAISCKVGQPLDERKLFQDAQSIGELYQKAGYQKASAAVQTPVIDKKAGQASVTIEIDEAPFTMFGTTWVEKVVDEAITQDIKKRFGGSRTLLIKTLKADGQTYEAYRKQQRASVMVKLKELLEKGGTNSVLEFFQQ